MKRIMILGIVLSCFITGCFSVGKSENKTSFHQNESGVIDQFEVTLKSVSEMDDIQGKKASYDLFIEYQFEIKNTSNQEVIIDSSMFRLKNLTSGSIVTIHRQKVSAGKTISYAIVYDVKREDKYPILFYSGTVDNNIEFVFSH